VCAGRTATNWQDEKYAGRIETNAISQEMPTSWQLFVAGKIHVLELCSNKSQLQPEQWKIMHSI